MTHQRTLDFNCDMGEGCGDDAAIAPWISSASIACGGHAGDDDSMRTTLRLCRAHRVSAGAHPGYPDAAHFGRRELGLPVDALRRLLDAQLQRIAGIAREEGVPLAHVKPHGALYHRSARDPAAAAAIAAAVHALDPGLCVYGPPGSELLRAAAAAGLPVVAEAFAERAYDPDGQLAPRDAPGAVLDGVEPALAQLRSLLRDGHVVARDGTRVPLQAGTVCLHGDRPGAAAFARALRIAIEAEGFVVRAPLRSAAG